MPRLPLSVLVLFAFAAAAYPQDYREGCNNNRSADTECIAAGTSRDCNFGDDLQEWRQRRFRRSCHVPRRRRPAASFGDTISVILDRGDGWFDAVQGLFFGDQGRGGQALGRDIADLDGDGDNGIVTLDNIVGHLGVSWGDGYGHFTRRPPR